MEPSYLTLSIDLDAEIAKITQKQYLNDVHYLVALVRHALVCRPGSIHITSTKATLEISHDGTSFPDDEWSLLDLILSPRPQDWQTRQEALTRLEEHHGIAILALLVNAEHCEIQSGSRSLTSRAGVVSIQAGLAQRPGYLISLRRDASPKTELRELSFFCAGATVPIYINGENINQAIEFSDQMLKMKFNLSEGSGAVGIPRIEDTCSLTFYKCGVRLGTRQMAPASGQIYHGYWDSHLTRFESDYRDSLTQGEAHLAEYAQLLYAAVPEHFEQFSHEDKIRLKKMLMRESGERWQQYYLEMPVFHSCRETFVLSLKHLQRLAGQFSAVPYSPRTHKDLPGFIPRLLPEDVFFLRTEMALAVKLVAAPRCGPGLELPVASGEEPLNANSDPLQRRFAEEVAQDGQHLIYFCPGRMGLATTRDGRTIVYLDETDDRVKEIIETYRQHTAAAGMLTYRLLALARG